MLPPVYPPQCYTDIKLQRGQSYRGTMLRISYAKLRHRLLTIVFYCLFFNSNPNGKYHPNPVPTPGAVLYRYILPHADSFRYKTLST